jgi:hypothetical protein
VNDGVPVARWTVSVATISSKICRLQAVVNFSSMRDAYCDKI